jgi:DNA-directed RNA polymerase subunit F
MHEGLSLRGMISDKREVEYIISLLSEIKRNIREDEVIKLADFLEKTAKELRSMYKNDSTQ